MRLVDINGEVIALDGEVIVNRFRNFSGQMLDDSYFRAKVVGIGDPGLPGRAVIKVRQYGSQHVETVTPTDCEVHAFDDYAWVRAESDAANEMQRRADIQGWKRFELAKCLFGGFYFEPYQRLVCSLYVKGAVACAA